MTSRQPAIWFLSILLAGCSFWPEQMSIADQLNAEGGCWDVDLSDGLEDETTTEMHALFGCLNRTGNLKAFGALDRSMDVENRQGEPIGLPLIRISNSIATSDYDMLGLAGKALDVLRDYRDETQTALQFFVELVYAEPFAVVQEEALVDDPTAVDHGILKPAVHMSSNLAGVLMDGGSDTRESIIALTENQAIQNAACLIEGIQADPNFTSITDDLIVNAVDAWELADDASNNRWSGETGNSFRDLIDNVIVFRHSERFSSVKRELGTILSDDLVRVNTKAAFVDVVDSGHLEHMLSQTVYLSSVDVAGRDLTDPHSDSISALQVGLRLLHQGNRPLTCTFLFFETNIDNMATRILRELAGLDSTEVEDGLDLLVTVLGGDIAPALLRTTAASGVCAGLTPSLLDDLQVLERLNDPQVGNLVEVIHSLLDAVYVEGRVDRLPELVNIIEHIHLQGLIKPIEEILRDLHTAPVLNDTIDLVPILLDPSNLDTSTCEEGSEPLTFDHTWAELQDWVTLDYIPEEPAIDLFEEAVADEYFWTVVDRTAHLAGNPASRIHDLEALLSTVEDDEVDIAGFSENFLEDEEMWNTIFMTLESPEVRDALIEHPEEGSSPLPYMAKLVLSDTVTVMLQTIDVVLDSLSVE